VHHGNPTASSVDGLAALPFALLRVTDPPLIDTINKSAGFFSPNFETHFCDIDFYYGTFFRF
jgi:hypothetical protein